MKKDTTIKITIDCDEGMEIIKEQAKILNKDPGELFMLAIAQSLQKKAAERGMELRIEGIEEKKKS